MHMNRILRALSAAAALFLSFGTPARADEGMWMVNALSRALVSNMEERGLELQAGEIYNAGAVSLSSAIVSLDFGCTGSMVSERGLLITNHHCAYGDVHALSTAEHNYLEDGFTAATDADEIYIPGKKAYFLQSVIDVTDEVNTYIEEQKAAGQPFGFRRVSSALERRWSTESGLEASLSSMWAGSRYYMALYKVFTDIRLVAAPPVSIAAFGGDVDNWEWPQHKCDFALYRIYAGPDGEPAVHSGDNIPWEPDRILPVSTAGYTPGSFTMILGYPGRTDRYASSAKVRYETAVSLPINTEARGAQMEIIKKWMDADPAIRLKYSDRFFSLSNVQELQSGQLQCCKRFKVAEQKHRSERSCLKGRENRALLHSLDSCYTAIRNAEKNLIWFRETMIRGSRLSLIATRLKNHAKDFSYDEEYGVLDLRVEKELMRYNLEAFYENVDSVMWGPYQTEVRERFSERDGGACDYTSMLEYLWTDDWITPDDRLFRFLTETTVRDYNSALDKVQGRHSISDLGRQYTRALYSYRLGKGIPQYPDANSTMRLTYGTVGSFVRDGKEVPWQTFPSEILAKEDTTRYDFTLKDGWRAILPQCGEPVNFLTDNDITGGNSGSPVLNSKGELIGLAFDGNKESLASDVAWTEGWNKCVCVDIRFVLWTLHNYMGMDRILDEMLAESTKIGTFAISNE